MVCPVVAAAMVALTSVGGEMVTLQAACAQIVAAPRTAPTRGRDQRIMNLSWCSSGYSCLRGARWCSRCGRGEGLVPEPCPDQPASGPFIGNIARRRENYSGEY